jgi:hypothetical protein
MTFGTTLLQPISGHGLVGITLLMYLVYGTQGIPSTSNNPGARDGSVSWIDSNGFLWLFGT